MSSKYKYRRSRIFDVSKNVFLDVLVFALILASLPLSSQALSVDEIDLDPPRAPMNFTAESLDGALKLAWTSIDQTDVTEYKVYLRNEKEQLEPQTTDETSITIAGLDNKILYSVQVTAFDSEGNESRPSNEIGITPSKVEAVTQKPYKVAAWMPTNWDVEDAFEAFNNNLDVYDILSPFWFSANMDGSLEAKGGARDQDLINKAHDNNILVIPSITNNYSTEKSSALLKSPASILNHIDIIVREVVDNNYDGIDIDYENVSKKEKEQYTFFMKNLSHQLHENDKLLSITSQPKLSDHYTWNGPGAIDWDVVGEVADYLRIMNYDYSRPNTPPGPVAPKEWLRKSMQYALEHVPREKILGGVPFYGYDWALTESGETSGIVWDGVQNTLEKYGMEIFWDEEAGESWYEYSDEVGPRKAYFNDARSIEEKLKVINEEDVGGITIWRLGSEDPAIFDMIRKYLGKEDRLNSPARVKVIPKNRSAKLSWTPNTNDSVAGYYVYAGPSSDTMEKIATVNHETHEYIMTGLENEETYFVQVTAFNGREEESTPLNLARIQPTSLVTAAPITNLSREDLNASSLQLTWSYEEHPDFVGNILGFDVRYSRNEITPENWHEAEQLPSHGLEFSRGSSFTYFVEGLTPDTEYSFAVKSIDEFQQPSAMSNIVTTRTLDISPPDAPQKLDIEEQENGEAKAVWQLGNDYDLAGYKMYFTTEDQIKRWVYIGLRSEYVLDFLQEDAVYDIYIVAVDNSGNESIPSESRSILSQAK